jgi:sigma-B regulation protein RsbU (phosphoserine phosphatase)
MEGGIYKEVLFDVHPGDAFMISSDGLSGMVNAAGEVYGISRLRKVLEQSEPYAITMGQSVISDFGAFRAGAPSRDDLTLVCIGRDR